MSEARRVGSPRSAVDQDEIDLAEYLAIVWRHRWMTLIEAMSCSRPVVAFNATGPRDILSHCRTGYLAQPFEAHVNSPKEPIVVFDD